MSKIYERQCILGIKLNGTSFSLTTLEEGDLQSSFDYIVNTTNSSYNKGNGFFSISILNKNFEKGLPINNWTLLEGRIVFNWGSSDTYFILVDENGERTKNIFACSGRGAASGFNIENLTRSIFPKARDIISEYPSARIYNTIQDFISQGKKIKDFHREYIKEETDSYKAINYYQDKVVIPLYNYFKAFNEIHSLLRKEKDSRSEKLLEKLMQDFRDEIQQLFD